VVGKDEVIREKDGMAVNRSLVGTQASKQASKQERQAFLRFLRLLVRQGTQEGPLAQQLQYRTREYERTAPTKENKAKRRCELLFFSRKEWRKAFSSELLL
jgi:hypothetical protein